MWPRPRVRNRDPARDGLLHPHITPDVPVNVELWQVIAGIVGTVLASAGVSEAIRSFARRGPTKAEAAATVQRMTLDLSTALQVQAETAQRRFAEMAAVADQAQSDLRRVSREVDRLSMKVEALAERMHYWRRSVLDPQATLERLRAMVASEPGENGRASDH